MITPILAAALTLQTILTSAEDFSTRVGLDVPRPITTNMVTKFRLVPEDHYGFAVISNTFVFSWLRGVICEYIDNRESMHRNGPAELKRWSEQPCLLDEKRALELARDYFRKLGFKEEEFEPPKCYQYRYATSFERRNEPILLPLFRIEWLEKGAKKPEGEPLIPIVEMYISGTTKRMIYFSSTGFLGFGKKSEKRSHAP